MKDRFYHNIGIKLLSVIIAFIIWVLVVNIDDYIVTKTIAKVPVEVINEDAITDIGKVYELDDDAYVDVVVKGPRSTVETMSSADIDAYIDLQLLSATDAAQVFVSPRKGLQRNKVTVTPTKTQIKVKLEELVEESLNITVNISGTPADGYAVISKSTTPNIITVSGAKSAVAKIKSAQVTVNMDGTTADVKGKITPILLGDDGEMINAKSVSISESEVEANVTIGKTKTVPVKVETFGTVKEGYTVLGVEYQPDEMLIAGDAEALKNVTEILIKDININGVASNYETNVLVNDYLPEGVKTVEDNAEIMITVSVEEHISKELTLLSQNVKLSGEKEEYSYQITEILSPKISIKGLYEEVGTLTLNGLNPSADVSELEPGEYEVEIKYTIPDGSNLEISSEAKVKLVVSEKPQV
ncbi:MAG: hypothetical protein IKQ71_06890 [Lachnospiraceae bacterium]|nr:hypothetical protein [Lachnospiraceae bacterium]